MYMSWRKEWTAPAVGVVSFAAGAAAGYFYCQRTQSFEVEETVTRVVQDMDAKVELEFVEDTQIKAYQAVLDGFVKALKDADLVPLKESPDEVLIIEPDMPKINQNIHIPEAARLAIVDGGWDYREEQENRTPDAPYVIHRDEFFNEETGYRQTTLTWYDGDKILADEQDVPIYGPEKIVGSLRFGHGSGDADVVYIRNEKMSAEYEITRHTGSFQTEVMGIQAEEEAEADDLKHSKHIPRFRMD